MWALQQQLHRRQIAIDDLWNRKKCAQRPADVCLFVDFALHRFNGLSFNSFSSAHAIHKHQTAGKKWKKKKKHSRIGRNLFSIHANRFDCEHKRKRPRVRAHLCAHSTDLSNDWRFANRIFKFFTGRNEFHSRLISIDCRHLTQKIHTQTHTPPPFHSIISFPVNHFNFFFALCEIRTQKNKRQRKTLIYFRRLANRPRHIKFNSTQQNEKHKKQASKTIFNLFSDCRCLHSAERSKAQFIWNVEPIAVAAVFSQSKINKTKFTCLPNALNFFG